MKSQDKILRYLLAGKPLSVLQISEMLGISKNATYQHVKILTNKQLIIASGIETDIGRPTQYYILSQKGNDLFDDGYKKLVIAILHETNLILGENKLEEILTNVGNNIKKQFDTTNNFNEMLRLGIHPNEPFKSAKIMCPQIYSITKQLKN